MTYYDARTFFCLDQNNGQLKYAEQMPIIFLEFSKNLLSFRKYSIINKVLQILCSAITNYVIHKLASQHLNFRQCRGQAMGNRYSPNDHNRDENIAIKITTQPDIPKRKQDL